MTSKSLIATGKIFITLAITIASLSGCESREATRPAATPTRNTIAKSEPVQPESPSPLGRWKGAHTCIELLANGDVELSLPSQTPKILVMGRSAIRVDAKNPKRFHIEVQQPSIWQAGYTSSCRKVHETGHFIQSVNILGSEVIADQTAFFTFEIISAREAELCASKVGETMPKNPTRACERLTKDVPLLRILWHRAERDASGTPIPPKSARQKTYIGISQISTFSPGDLLALDLAARSQTISLKTSNDKLQRVRIEVQISPTEPDIFRLEVHVLQDQGNDVLATPVHVLGTLLEHGTTMTWTAKRLPNQGLELCGSEANCQILYRHFGRY